MSAIEQHAKICIKA